MDSRWDLKYLGMQILVEGLAMAAFANLYQLAEEPLLKELIHYVMRDESRHVAFGVLSLRGYYQEMPANELARARGLRDRGLPADARPAGRRGDRRGDRLRPRARCASIMLESPIMQMFRQALFARVVPNIKRLGLLTPRVRRAFEEMRVIQFEDADPEAQDRALGLACELAWPARFVSSPPAPDRAPSAPRARRCCRAAGA